MEVDVLNLEGEAKGKANLPDSLAKGKENKHLLYEVVRAYLANQRKGTHSTLGRSEVRGGGKKPWRQKHTGRARSGTSRSPLWRGGGIIFGPKPRSYRIDLPKGKIKGSLGQVLSAKLRRGDLVVAEKPVLEEAKTKKVTEWLKKLSLPEKSLLVVKDRDEKLLLATRNLPHFSVRQCSTLHPYHVLSAQKVVFTPEAVQCL